MGDGGKGSSRRNEDGGKVRDNWDKIDWGKKDNAKEQQPEQTEKKEK